MVPSSNFNLSYFGVEYTILPNLGEIDCGEGAEINQNMSHSKSHFWKYWPTLTSFSGMKQWRQQKSAERKGKENFKSSSNIKSDVPCL